MFVLMDIEWIENQIHYITPTQIAAMRVDEQWRCHDRFYSRIRPRDSSFHQWAHMAYTGAAGRRPPCGGVSRNIFAFRSMMRPPMLPPRGGRAETASTERERDDQSAPLPTKNFHPRISDDTRPSGIFFTG